MKHPKFVGKDWLEFTRDELERLRDMFEQIFLYDKISLAVHTPPCNTAAVTVKLVNPPKKIFIPERNSRVEHLSQLTILFWKQSGRDNPNDPAYVQYSVKMTTDGVEHITGRRHTHDSFNFEGSDSYAYDDCLEGLFPDIVRWLWVNNIVDNGCLDGPYVNMLLGL